MRGGRRQAARERGSRCVQGRGSDCRFVKEGAWRRSHPEHVAHVSDAGCVPAERLVEGVRSLPRVASRAYEAGRAAGPRRGAAGGEQSRCAQRAGERVQLHCLGGLGLGAAHVKHAPHDRDAGGVPAQWLVEGERPLPRVAGHMVRRELERAGRRRGGGVCVRGARSVKEGGRLRGGARGAAHEKHAVHGSPLEVIDLPVAHYTGPMGVRVVSPRVWAWMTRLPVGSAPPARCARFFGRPRRLRARAFDRAHIDVVDIDVVDIDVVDIDVVVTRLAPQLASQLPPRAARAARAWNERRRRPRSPTASTTSPRRRHLALRLSRRARARCARRSRHVARSPPLLGAAAAARVARAARVAPPLVGAPFLELDVAPRHEPRRIGARLVNWRRAGASEGVRASVGGASVTA